MTLLLHGDNIVASQAKIDELRLTVAKDQYYSYEAKGLATETLIQTLSSSSLFGPEKKLVVVSNPLSNKTLLENLPAINDEVTLVLWEQKKLTPSQVKTFMSQFANLTELEFKSDNAIFRFVENIKPHDNQALKILESDLALETPEVIITMLIRQFRFLLLAASTSKAGPEEWQRLSSWQLSRLNGQAKSFTVEQLKSAYQKLEELDYQNKTGQLPYPLIEGIKFFLLQL